MTCRPIGPIFIRLIYTSVACLWPGRAVSVVNACGTEAAGRDKVDNTRDNCVGGRVCSAVCCQLSVLWFVARLLATGCRAMLCISAAYAVMRCLCVHVSVCVSVTFVNSVETSSRIVRLFSPSGRPIILVFQYKTGWQYSDGDPQNGASNARGYEKITIFTNVSLCLKDHHFCRLFKQALA